MNWFKKFGWIYLPVSEAGVIISFCTITFIVQGFISIDQSSQSVSDTLFSFVPYAAMYLLMYTLVASKTSIKEARSEFGKEAK